MQSPATWPAWWRTGDPRTTRRPSLTEPSGRKAQRRGRRRRLFPLKKTLRNLLGPQWRVGLRVFLRKASSQVRRDCWSWLPTLQSALWPSALHACAPPPTSTSSPPLDSSSPSWPTSVFSFTRQQPDRTLSTYFGQLCWRCVGSCVFPFSKLFLQIRPESWCHYYSKRYYILSNKPTRTLQGFQYSSNEKELGMSKRILRIDAYCLQIGTFLQNSFCWLPFNGDGHDKSWFKTTHDKLFGAHFTIHKAVRMVTYHCVKWRLHSWLKLQVKKSFRDRLESLPFFWKKGCKEGKVMLNCQTTYIKVVKQHRYDTTNTKDRMSLRVSGAFYCFYTASFLAPRPLSVSAVFNIRSNLHRVLCGHSF